MPGTELRFLGLDLTPVFEPGEVEILVGPCADRAQLLAQTIRLVESPAQEVAGWQLERPQFNILCRHPPSRGSRTRLETVESPMPGH